MKDERETDMVIMRAKTGELGVLPGHEEYYVVLDYGKLRILDAGTERVMLIEEGIARIRDNIVTIVTHNALWPEDIDRVKVEADQAEAERQLTGHISPVDVQRAHVMMRRAQVQIEVSSYPIIRGS